MYRIASNIKNSVEVIKSSFSPIVSAATTDRYIKWNNDSHSCVILNVDGSCHGSLVITGFKGILRNNDGLFISVFFSRFHS